MGLTYVTLEVSKAKNTARHPVRLLVNSGAIFSVVPDEVLRRLGVKPDEQKTFPLADGQEIVVPSATPIFS
jgi:hypothetical protein